MYRDEAQGRCTRCPVAQRLVAVQPVRLRCVWASQVYRKRTGCTATKGTTSNVGGNAVEQWQLLGP